MAKLTAGDKAPGFEAGDQDGVTRRLADHRGKRLFVFFYPKASTSGCTVQAKAVRDALPELEKRGVAVVGISPDAQKQQKKFDDRHSLGFPLLCDTGHQIAEAYGVWGEKKMYGKTYMGIVRSSFLIDEKGRIAAAWYKISPKNTVPELMKVL